jgi:hypothetical protein
VWNRVTSVFVKEGTNEEHAVTAKEFALCYHNVKHSLSYRTFGCSTELTRVISK